MPSNSTTILDRLWLWGMRVNVLQQEADYRRFGFNLVAFDRCRKGTGAPNLVWLQLTPGIAGSEGQSPALWHKFVLTQE